MPRGQSYTKVRDKEQSCHCEETSLRETSRRVIWWVHGFLQPVVQALCLSKYIAPFCSDKLKLFSASHPYKGKLCSQPNNAVEEYLLTGKMYTRILRSAESMCLSFLQQIIYWVPPMRQMRHTQWGERSWSQLPSSLQSGYKMSRKIPLQSKEMCNQHEMGFTPGRAEEVRLEQFKTSAALRVWCRPPPPAWELLRNADSQLRPRPPRERPSNLF